MTKPTRGIRISNTVTVLPNQELAYRLSDEPSVAGLVRPVVSGVVSAVVPRALIHRVGPVSGREMWFEGPHRPSPQRKEAAFPGVRLEIGSQRHEAGRTLPVPGSTRQKQLFSPE